MNSFSIVIPAKNEEGGLKSFLPELKNSFPKAEIIVVNDGSSDSTSQVCRDNDVIVVDHPYSMGNGASIKSGARAATKPVIVFMDADGQHQPEDINRLLAKIDEGYDLVVGARDSSSQASKARLLANTIYNKLSDHGYFVVIDHNAAAGTGASQTKKLHRAEDVFVLNEVLNAGFILDRSSTVLANPNDHFTTDVWHESTKGKTDRFVLRFKKPS